MAERLSMTALSDAFERLTDLPEAGREAWIVEQRFHPLDRARLQRMLVADGEQKARFLDAPVLMHAQRLQDDPRPGIEPGDLIGQQFGAFRLERLIGQGGMAAVFSARRVGADFDQVVAVKLLRRGLFSSAEQDLFRRERQLLAGCTHPNIARFIDGGITSAGVPYLVLEYIDGLRLDEYVVARRLDVRARIRLFMRAAAAVESAHRALIVHRDIKPSNILVTADGTPKLLDFGVAKLLDEDVSLQTLTTALTPGYAAPEQLRGAPITTSVDVYALGVVLHELLTGERPSGPDADAPSIVVTRSPQRADGVLPAPSRQLRRMLRGDLDTIVQQALREKPQRRYASVAALIDDLQRYLDGRPVLAHPPSRRYVLRKFLRRNRIAVGIASAVLLGAVGLAAGALWQARETRIEASRANAVRDLLIDIFRTAEQSRPQGERAKPEEIVEQGMQRVLANAAVPEQSRLELIGVLATVAASIGAYTQMDTLTAEGMRIAGQLYASDDERSIDAHRLRAEALTHLNRQEEAAALLAPYESAWLGMDKRAAYEALIVYALARQKSGVGGNEESSMALLRRLRQNAEASTSISSELVFNIMASEADSLASIHRFKEALERGEAAESYWREQGLPSTGRMLWLYGAIGNAASSLGDSVRGEAAYRKAVALSERIHDRPHEDTAWFVGLLGSYLVALGRLDEAEPYVLRGLEMRRELVGDAAPSTLFAINALGRLRAAQGRYKEAVAALDEGVAACRKDALENDPCAGILQSRGRLHLQSGNLVAARSDIDAGIELQVRVTGKESPKVAAQYAYLAEVARREGHFAEAIATATRSLEMMEQFGGGHWTNIAVARLQRAWANLQIGNAQLAYEEMAEAEPTFAETSALNVKMRASMKYVAALALQQLGRLDEAKQWARSALDLESSGSPIDQDLRSTLQSVRDGHVVRLPGSPAS